MSLVERLVPGMVGMGLTGGAAVYFGRQWMQAIFSKRWPTAPGKIIRCSKRVVRHSKSSPGAAAEIEYEYTVAGQRHVGRRIVFGDNLTINVGVAHDRMRSYPVGREVTVHFNPKKPSESTLLTKATPMLLVWTALGGIMFLVILSAVINGE